MSGFKPYYSNGFGDATKLTKSCIGSNINISHAKRPHSYRKETKLRYSKLLQTVSFIILGEPGGNNPMYQNDPKRHPNIKRKTTKWFWSKRLQTVVFYNTWGAVEGG